MAIGGGFAGTSCAALLAFFIVRMYVHGAINEMVRQAHVAGQCPLCKQAVKHDDVPPHDVV